MKSETTELKTSHVPMLSKPREVAAVIIDAVTTVRLTKENEVENYGT